MGLRAFQSSIRLGYSQVPPQFAMFDEPVTQDPALAADWAGFLAGNAPARDRRQGLIDESRRDLALKCGGVRVQTRWLTGEHAAVTTGTDIELEKLDIAMRELHSVAQERAHLVELRFFSGLTIEETALAMAISDTTVPRQWRAARAWLLAHLSDDAVDD